MTRIDSRMIRVRMAELDMTRQALAEAAGITELTLRRIMNGSDCKLTTLESIATALDIKPRDLLTNGSAAASVEA